MLAIARKISFVSVLFVLLSLTFAPTVSAGLFDNSKQEACNGVTLSGTTPTSAPCDQNAQKTVNSLMKTVINLFSLVIGVISIIMIVISGLKYITSQGESAAVAGAKNALIYAIVGLVIVAFAQMIVYFVLTKTTQLPPCPAGQTQIAKPGDCAP